MCGQPDCLMPSNQRSTTRECAWSLLVTWQTWRSRHSIRRMLHAKFVSLYYIEPELLPIEVSHCSNRDFRLFLVLWPWPWPWPDEHHIRTWPVFPGIYRMCKYELPTSRLSRVIVWQTNRQTDTTEIIYHAASRVVDNVENWRSKLSADVASLPV